MVQLWIKPAKKDARFSVEVQPTDTVADVKKTISAAKGYQIAQQRLIYQGAVLRDDAKLVEMNLPAHTHLILHIRVPQEVAPPVPSEPSLPLPANPIPLSSSPPGPISNPGALFAAADVQSILHNLSVQFGVPPAAAGGAPAAGSPGPASGVNVPVSAPPRVPPPPQSVLDMQVDAGALQALLEMGFPEIRARKALLVNRGALNLAMEWLFEHASHPDIDSPQLSEDQRRALQGGNNGAIRINAGPPGGQPAGGGAPVLQLPVQPVHPDAEQCIQRGQCTIVASGRNFVPQYYQHCYTCGFNTNEGCCTSCARNCHRGHNVSPPIYSPGFYCDCGAGARVPCKSLPANFQLD